MCVKCAANDLPCVAASSATTARRPMLSSMMMMRGRGQEEDEEEEKEETDGNDVSIPVEPDEQWDYGQDGGEQEEDYY